jgi:secretion/DNA translocation related TadE-like protein
VLALALVGVLTTALAAVVMLGGAVMAKTRAQTAADLAALAGAQALLDHLGAEVACTEARAVALANGAESVTCTITGVARCEVTVSRRVSPAVGGQGPMAATATAVAGHPP